MAIFTDGQIHASIHDFKTNLSKYIRLLEEGRYRAVVVRRYNKTVGVFITLGSQKLWERRQREQKAAGEFENVD